MIPTGPLSLALAMSDGAPESPLLLSESCDFMYVIVTTTVTAMTARNATPPNTHFHAPPRLGGTGVGHGAP